MAFSEATERRALQLAEHECQCSRDCKEHRGRKCEKDLRGNDWHAFDKGTDPAKPFVAADDPSRCEVLCDACYGGPDGYHKSLMHATWGPASRAEASFEPDAILTALGKLRELLADSIVGFPDEWAESEAKRLLITIRCSTSDAWVLGKARDASQMIHSLFTSREWKFYAGSAGPDYVRRMVLSECSALEARVRLAAAGAHESTKRG